jgi:predicted metal-dependent hydrolase
MMMIITSVLLSLLTTWSLPLKPIAHDTAVASALQSAPIAGFCFVTIHGRTPSARVRSLSAHSLPTRDVLEATGAPEDRGPPPAGLPSPCLCCLHTGDVIHSLAIDDLIFSVRWSRRRRTIGISVGAAGELRVLAPVGCRRRALEAAVRERLGWVRKKMAEQEARAAAAAHAYVDGELFPYLGRRYPLELVDGAAVRVELRDGRFLLDRTLAPEAQAELTAWYTARARSWIPPRLDSLLAAGGPAPSAVQVRAMGRRWGSCTANGKISLHWQTILLPPAIIDYILVHELMHLRRLDHSTAFWDCVANAMPDYVERRTWLRVNGHLHVL